MKPDGTKEHATITQTDQPNVPIGNISGLHIKHIVLVVEEAVVMEETIMIRKL